MGKTFRDDDTLGLALQTIITDGAGSSQSLFHVTRLKHLARLLGIVGPNTCKAICL
jgi:hypothetical protein